MTPPRHPPVFSEPIYGMETTGAGIAELAGWLLDNLAADAGFSPDWLAEVGPGLPFRIRLVDHERARGVTLGFTAGNAEGEIRAGLDPSGWVRMRVTLGGEEVFLGWLDRPYEEYHLWPDDAAAPPHADPRGRIGKRRNRVSLSAATWPGLSAWTREPRLNLSAVAD